MSPIPELTQACEIRAQVSERHERSVADERAYRALLLQAVSKGATRAQIQQSCQMSRSNLEAELRKARAETSNPKLRQVGLPHRALTLGEYWCPEEGCARSQGNGNEPLTSAQGLGMHRVAAHGYRLGEKPLTASIVRKLRAAPATVPTSELARKWGVSYHAARAARQGKTWRSV